MSEGKTLKKRTKLVQTEQRLDNHDEQMAFLRENMLTSAEYLEGQDQVMTALKNIRQELSFMYAWLRRHDEEIKQLQTARL